MYVNISGNYSSVQLKKYADDLKDKLENITQINRVDLAGAPESEFQINVDNFTECKLLVSHLTISLMRFKEKT